MSTFQVRQGDLLIESRTDVPGGLKAKNDNILAYGEVTGHSHRIVSPSFQEIEISNDKDGNVWLRSEKTMTLAHDEHAPIELPAGSYYCVSRQREYDPVAADRERQVRD